MSPLWDAGGTPGESEGGKPVGRPSGWVRPTRFRVAVVALGLVAAFLVAKNCQESQVKVSQDEAVAIAKDEVEFESTLTQVRFLRQGLDRVPYWVVSLSVPTGQGADQLQELALVRVNAETGEVASVEQAQPPAPAAKVTRDQAVATAAGRVDFTPAATKARLARVGDERNPVWVVTLSAPGADERSVIVRVDGLDGKVLKVREVAVLGGAASQ